MPLLVFLYSFKQNYLWASKLHYMHKFIMKFIFFEALQYLYFACRQTSKLNYNIWNTSFKVP